MVSRRVFCPTALGGVVLNVVLFPDSPRQPAAGEEPVANFEGLLAVSGNDRLGRDAIGQVDC